MVLMSWFQRVMREGNLSHLPEEKKKIHASGI
jgi:hypothetical protein